MAQISRSPLFTAEPNQPGPAGDDIFPREVRAPIMRLLWLGLLGVLAFLTVIIVLVWGICAF